MSPFKVSEAGVRNPCQIWSSTIKSQTEAIYNMFWYDCLGMVGWVGYLIRSRNVLSDSFKSINFESPTSPKVTLNRPTLWHIHKGRCCKIEIIFIQYPPLASSDFGYRFVNEKAGHPVGVGSNQVLWLVNEMAVKSEKPFVWNALAFRSPQEEVQCLTSSIPFIIRMRAHLRSCSPNPFWYCDDMCRQLRISLISKLSCGHCLFK